MKRRLIEAVLMACSCVVMAETELRTLFHLPFDHSEDSACESRCSPISRTGVERVRGHRGNAVRMTAKAHSRLEYPTKGNVNPDSGTVTFWFKADWQGQFDADRPWRAIFTMPAKNVPCNPGDGALKCWFWGNRFRGDLGDVGGHYTSTVRNELVQDGKWHYYAYSWGRRGVKIYFDGKRLCRRQLGVRSPTANAAMILPDQFTFDRKGFNSFIVGGNGIYEQADGAIDEFKIWNRQMADDEVSRCYAKEANPYEALPLAAAGDFGEKSLVEEVRLDSEGVARLKAAKRFRSEGDVNFGKLGQVDYLEATAVRSRYFVRFALDADVPLYVFEIDYPDDRKRTADIIVQRTGNPTNEYTTTCGYMTGDEYANTGRILTHRLLYWTGESDTAVVVMTPREDSPAAVSSIRVYRLDKNALPVARIDEPDGGGRMAGIHFEDISIGYNFATHETQGLSEREQDVMMDRCAATMKFSGQNLLAYPGAWYGDLMCRDGYDPRRNHAPDYRERWYERFDREGLFFMPTVHAHDMPVTDGLINCRSILDGTLHATPLSIHANGDPSGRGTHGSDPTFSFGHPDSKKRIREITDALLFEGILHKSFKGIIMHMSRYSYLWWGAATNGYNDYCIDAFSKATGIVVPIERNDAKRGKFYYEWLKENAWERWLDWRCQEVTRFYASIANRMAVVRPDLLLVLDAFEMARADHPRYLDEDFMSALLREAGFDPVALSKAAPNIVISETTVPANYRWQRDFRYPKENREALKAKMRTADLEAGFFRPLSVAARPMLHVHDKYWEDFVDYKWIKWERSKDPALRIDGDGFVDQNRRASVINPGGVHGMRQFAVPLARQDLLVMTKGGFAVGTYGLEERLAPFMQAFRALPPVVMKDSGVYGSVVVRTGSYRGREYVYFVNSDWKTAKVTHDFGGDVRDLVTGERYSGKVGLEVGGYSLRSFVETSSR